MFQLTNHELANLKSQMGPQVGDLQPQLRMHYRTRLAMLSRVLRRKRAVQVDIEFKEVFDAIRQLKTPPESSRKKIVFKVKEKGAVYKMKKGGGKGSVLQ